MKKKLLLPLIVFSLSAHAGTITANQAKQFKNESITVCGEAVEITSLSGDTFINIDKKHPNQDFYFYYYGSDFPISKFLSKKVCGTGIILGHKAKTQIMIESPGELEIIKDLTQ